MTRKPEPGAETAQAVLDIIENNPEQHDQATWSCGTTYCVGGWALTLHAGASPGWGTNYAHRAAELLGLNRPDRNPWDWDQESDAYRLFFNTSDEEAVEALRYIAGGKEIDWEKVYGE